jgi:ATP-dependent RNA helicase SUPV3L1/SUV3
MFPFSALNKTVQAPEATPTPVKTNEPHPLDAMTGGAFSAHTSGERTARIRDWLATAPSAEHMQAVFKELSGKDKGAAKLLREKLEDIKRSKSQDSIAQDWADKAQALLALAKLNIADAMAWQRDAAKAGAPLSKEPLATLKGQLSDRVKVIEDLQHRVQVQREAAVLLAQRIEVLSTKPWRDAQAVLEALHADVDHWQAQAVALSGDANWPSVESKFPPLLDASRAQLLLVWDAFKSALTQAVAAASDPAAALPPVPVWADELRVARGVPLEPAAKPQKAKVDPEIKAQALSIVREALLKLEQEVAEGHGKASAGAAGALRNALKEFGKIIDDKLENQAHAALAAAGELEGWQRWRADQLREELVAKAEGLLKRPEGQAIGGRKMQESLRTLRDQWKQTDQGGVPNHGLWKRFDDACNEAYKVVEAWLEKVKAESAEHRAQRLALIEEVNAWAAANPVALDDDWKGFNRLLHQFGDRWREGGHVGEKMFAELQPLWKAAIDKAAAPLEALQKQSLVTRHALIDEARALGAEPVLRIDAVKALQQRWQAETHVVPLERRQEQKLWDAFRKPIDEAFNRKTAEREKADAALGERDRVVLDAAKALEAANAAGDAQLIRSAMSALEAALRGQAQAKAAQAALPTPEEYESNKALAPVDTEQEAINKAAKIEPSEAPSDQAAQVTPESAEASTPVESVEPAAPLEPPAPLKAAPRPVVAVRGDDRPGMKKTEPAPMMRGGKFGDRKDGGRDAARDASRGPRDASFAGRPDDRAPRRDARDGRDTRPFAAGPWQEAPRLGDTAFRAQRDALEHAQLTLRKLAAQAHGEALTQLLAAWEQRSADQMPSLQELGSRVTAAGRSTWSKAVAQAPAGDASTVLLRLEMAAEVPTPAEHLSARRLLQLQLLTKRNDPAPAQTWGQDTAAVLASQFEAGVARRLQNVLKVLLKP